MAGPNDDGAPQGRLNPLGMAALLGSNVLVFLGLFSLAPDLPAVRAQFAGVAQVDLLTQLVGATSGFTFALGCLASGKVIGRFGDRSVYLVSVLVFALAGAAAALLPNIHAIILTRAVVGLASAGIVNGALVAVGRLTPESQQGRILGLQAMIGSVAAIVGFPLIGQLAGLDWRLAFLLHLAGLAFAPLILALPAAKGRAARGAEAPVAAPARLVAPLVMATTICVGMIVFIGTVFGPLFLSSLGVTDARLLSIPPTAGALGSTAGSALYVVLRSRMSLAGAFALALGAMAVGLATIGFSPSVWGVAAGSFIAVLGGGLFSPNMNAAAIQASPDNPGPGLGLINALLYGSMILFPLVATPLSNLAGGPRSAILGFAVLAAALAAAFVVAARTQGPKSAPAAAS